MYVLGVNDARQTEIHTAEPLVTGPRAFEDELVIEKQKHKNYQVLIKSEQKWLKHGGEQFALRFMNLLILF